MIQNQPVEMLAVCDTMGTLRPIRFRVEDEEAGLQVVRILEVLSCKEIQYVGVEAFSYLCSGELGGRRRLMELRYTVRTHRWVLFRMID